MDRVIQFVTVLFLLSMICERVAEFLKHYLTCKKIYGFHVIGDATTKHPEDSPEELRRHYRILKLNLVCGFFTAFLCHASLFDILRNIENPGKVLGWPEKMYLQFCRECILNNIAFLMGCLLTGAFISLGSKFWHDLLDILLAAKNAKKAVTNLNTSSDFNSLPREEKFQLIEAAIKENKESWKNNIRNYKGVSIADKLIGENNISTNQLAIRFNVSKKEDISLGAKTRVPAFVYYEGYKIPTDVLETGDAVAIDSPINPKELPRPLGSSIGRGDTTFSGTLGLSVNLTVEGKSFPCGVSCYHVLFPEELKNNIKEVYSSSDTSIISNPVIYAPSRFDYKSQMNIGSVAKGKFTHFIDIGFFKTTPDFVSPAVYKFGKPRKLHDLRQQDEGLLKVKICGRTSGFVEGTVISIKTDQIITYFKDSPLAFQHELEDLIQIRMKTLPGDSGSALLTEDGDLVGIVVASDSTTTYAIPIQFLKSNFNIEFNLQNN